MTNTSTKKKSRARKSASSIRRPRSAYNFFYKHQRSCILGELELSSSRSAGDERCSSTENVSAEVRTHSDRDRSLTLRKSIFNQDVAAYLLEIDDGTYRKRKHRKTHGMINLKQLTLSIAQRWKHIDAETKQQYQSLAERDKERYKRDMINQHEQLVGSFDLIEQHDQVDEYTPRRVEEILFYGPGNMVRGEENLTKSDVNYVMNILLCLN